MINKIEQYGMKNNEFKFFEKYLCNRKQQIRSKKSLSDETQVPIGLPQGTERVQHIKYLGFEIDEKLKFEYRIDSVTDRTAMKINLLKKISGKLTINTKKILYNTLVAPNFEYCSTLYLNCNNGQIDQLQQLQNRAIRIILNCEYRTHRVDMLNELNWLSISQKIKYNTLIMVVFKMKNSLAPFYLNENINYINEIHDRNTKNKNNFRLHIPRTEQMKNNLFYNGLKMFNELSNQIKEIDNITKFKEEY